jgi:hypothetical protein
MRFEKGKSFLLLAGRAPPFFKKEVLPYSLPTGNETKLVLKTLMVAG